MTPSKKIYLIGMPGSGKSSLGQQISRDTTYSVTDLDSYIEAKHNRTINDLIVNQGEEFFRIAESIALREVSHHYIDLIVCGGGTPCFHQNIEYMKSQGKVVYLDIALEILQERFETLKEGRPLLSDQSMSHLTALYQSRKADYQQADLSIKANLAFEQLVALLDKHGDK